MSYDAEKFTADLNEVLKEVRLMLIEKNKNYGDSALSPLSIFSKLPAKQRLFVRMDDKLSRLARGEDAGEDTLNDLLGYLVLEKIDRKRNATAKQD